MISDFTLTPFQSLYHTSVVLIPSLEIDLVVLICPSRGTVSAFVMFGHSMSPPSLWEVEVTP